MSSPLPEPSYRAFLAVVRDLLDLLALSPEGRQVMHDLGFEPVPDDADIPPLNAQPPVPDQTALPPVPPDTGSPTPPPPSPPRAESIDSPVHLAKEALRVLTWRREMPQQKHQGQDAC